MLSRDSDGVIVPHIAAAARDAMCLPNCMAGIASTRLAFGCTTVMQRLPV